MAEEHYASMPFDALIQSTIMLGYDWRAPRPENLQAV